MSRKIQICGGVGWEITADGIKEELGKVKDGEAITLEIVSPGGSVFEGIAIYNAIIDFQKQNPKSIVDIEINGVCASMGSYIASVPINGKRTAKSNAVYMIHNAWGISVGNHNQMRKDAEILDGLSDIMANAYASISHKPKQEIKSLMNDETWFFGNEIKDNGFVTDIIEAEEIEEKQSASIKAKALFAQAQAKLKEITNTEDYQKQATAFYNGAITAKNQIKTTEKKQEQEMTPEELEKNNAEILKKERERVAELSSLKAKHGTSCGALAQLIDEAIASGQTWADISANAFTLMADAKESTPSINTGVTNNAIGSDVELEEKPEENQNPSGFIPKKWVVE